MKATHPQKRRHGSQSWGSHRQRPRRIHPLQLEHLEPRQMLNGTSIVSWEPPAVLSTTASDSFGEREPQLATDSAGNWIAVWEIWGASHVRYSRSTDNGHTWTDAAPLSGDVTGSSGTSPQVTTDSLGTWIAVWASHNPLGDTIGTDSDILFSRSMDVGQTWSAPAPLNTNAANDNSVDAAPQLTTDAAGNWIAVWQSTGGGGPLGTDDDILYSRSTDKGHTWTDPAPLNTNAATDSGDDFDPQLTTDSAGNWIAVWTSDDSLGGAIGDERDILFSRSTNNGATWTPPAALNVNAAIDSGRDYDPQLTTDSAGNWIAIWVADEIPGGVTDMELVFSRSTDAGHSWTEPAALIPDGTSDLQGSWYPQLTTDSAGNWIAVWYVYNSEVDLETDLLFSRSTDIGDTWSDAALLNTNGATDSRSDRNPQVTTDSAGTWIAVWMNAGYDIGDSDIFFARGTIRDVTTLFADSFEHGQWNGLWVEDSQNDWFTSTQRRTDGSYSAEVDGSASNATITIAAPIDLTPYSSAELSFDWLIESGLDAGEYLALDFFNGSSWQEVAKLSGNVDTENTWHNELLTIDGQYQVSNFQFRFRAKMSGSDEDANVDNVQLIGISAAEPNAPPTTLDDVYNVNEDTTLIVPASGVLANDSDADLDLLTARLVTNVSHGSLVWHTDGSFSYTPAVDFNGTDSFTYRVCDGSDYSETATVFITVEPVNDAPVADDQLTQSRTNGSRSITLTASDVEFDPLAYGVVTPPAHGTLSGIAPDLIYTPATGYLGSDSFTFRAHDGTEPSNLATVTIDVAANQLPEADPQTITLDEDCPQAILLSGTDLNADPLTYHIVDPPHNGTLSGTAPDLVYTPNADYFGSDAFTFLVNDSTDDSLPATVSLTIRSVYDQPQVEFATYIGGTGNDNIYAMALADDGHTFVTGYTSSVDLPNAVSGSVYGGGSFDGFVAKIDPTGAVVWTRYLGGTGSDYGYGIAMDGSGNVFVTGYTNSEDLATGYMGGSYDGFVAKIDGTGSAHWITYLGGTGSDYARGIAVDGSGNLFVAGYTESQDLPNPTNGFQGGTRDTFVARIDAAGAVVWTTYLGGSGSDYAASYPAIAIDSSQNVFVAGYTDSPDLAHRINAYQGGTSDGFVAKLSIAGTVTWTMYLGGTDFDHAWGITADGTDNVLVAGQTLSGDLPTATNANHGACDAYVARINGQGSVQWTTYLGGSDDDNANAVATSGSGDVFVTGYSLAAAIGGRDATLTQLDSATGHVVCMTYLGGTRNDSGQRVATDGEGRVYVAGYTYSTDLPGALNTLQGDRDGFLIKLDPSTISPLPAEPPVALGDSYSVSWNRTLQIGAPGVLANDSDLNEDALTAVLVDGGEPINGTLTLNADGSLSYTPTAGFVGTDTFAYQAFDGAFLSDIAVVTIEVVNQAPVAVLDSYTMPFQTQLVVGVPGVLANDSDPNEDALTAVLVAGGAPSNGTLTLNDNGSFSYAPMAGFVGTDTFSYQAFDGALYSAVATVTIEVQPGEVTLVYSNSSSTPIRDWSTTTSTINVPDAMNILDVNVQLNISHTRDQDLDVYLRSPDGTRVELFTDVGGNGDHFTNTVLDDQASVSITAGSAPFAGTYRPEGSLAAFNGRNSAGTWTLEVTDDKLFYSGTLNSWSITITGAPMAAASGANSALASDAPALPQSNTQQVLAMAGMQDTTLIPVTSDPLLDLQQRPDERTTSAQSDTSPWTQWLEPLVQAHLQVRDADSGVRDTRALREALERSIEPLEDDLLELLAGA